MTVTELRESVGEFGTLTTKKTEDGYCKTLPGRLKDMDTRGTVWFVDNDGFGHAFKAPSIVSFEIKTFEPLPAKHKGKELVDIGGEIVYKGTTKECDLKK